MIATAGHVDHGKSALLRALTGMEPDRWEEERRRGLTIDLGFVWTQTDRGPIAFVDVPGHERFVANMLAGVGPVPAVLFVVAADEGWMPQSAEHLLALHALNVRHGLLAVTKTDLADPAPAATEALEHLRRTSLRDTSWLGVSARTGQGLAELRAAIRELSSQLPDVESSAPIRLWVDRAFTVRGAGLVITGTLPAGTVRLGDTLELARTGRRFVIREIQSLNRHVDEAVGVARVALNLRGAGSGEIRRGDALMTPGSYRRAAVADVRLHPRGADELPHELLVHLGAATVGCRMRPIGTEFARLMLDVAQPLRVGDRVVLRHGRRVAGGAIVLDVEPPKLNQRGAAQRRARELDDYPDTPDGASEVRRRGIVRGSSLRAIGVEPPWSPLVGDWLLSPELHRALAARLATMVAQRAEDPSAPPLAVADVCKTLDLPDGRLVAALLTDDLAIRNGVIVPGDAPDTLAPTVRHAVAALAHRLAQRDLGVPTADDLATVGLGTAEISAAVRSGKLLRLAPGVVLLPDSVGRLVAALARLPQPFTAGQAREALGTTRKVIVPLLEHLAAHGHTYRTADGQHRVTGR